MTPAETAAILHQFNEWRRGDEDIPQFDPRDIGEVIDAAVEMIDRLEAAESEAIEQARLNGMGAERELALMAKLEAAEKERDECNSRRLEAADHFAAQTALMKEKCDALRAKIEQMERQEPVAWARKLGLDVPSFGCVTDLKYRPSNIPESSYIPLYALPGAQTQGDSNVATD